MISASIALTVAGVPALANDSTATTAAGGLVLEKTNAIAMEREDLFVSADQVRVRYVFRNLTYFPVRTVVAFPMPPRPLGAEYGEDIAYPSHFRTRVEGIPVKATLERKALLGGKDVREQLVSLGIPVAPDNVMTSTAAMDRLPPAERKRLLKLGLASEEEHDDDDKGMKKHLIPQWTVQDSYYWTQLFPAQRAVSIDHSYVPGAGGSVDSALGSREFRASPQGKAMMARYCVDRSLVSAIDARRGRNADGPMMPDRIVDYILKTGSNWARPIGTFRLVVDKGRSTNLVSFCGDGVRSIGSTQFEMVKRNWRPTDDLHVLILEPAR